MRTELTTMLTYRTSVRGFTLLEILIVVAIAAISLTIAAPNLRSFIADQHVRTTAADLAQDLGYARVNAIATGKNTVVQPLTANTWTSGWMTYTDVNANGAFDGTDILLKQTVPTTGSMKICTTGGGVNSPELATSVQYRPDGSVVRTSAVTPNDGLTVSDKQNSVNTAVYKIRSLYFGPSGRTSIVVENGDYNLTVPGTPCP
jgi:prepilin-type N-terminal cleavage/methylation domain-containing protein